MDYGSIRSHFMELLNRDDCTADLADTFLSQGFRRTMRVLRVPLFRVVDTFTVDETWTGTWTFPADYAGVYGVTVSGYRVNRITTGQEDTLAGFKMTSTGISFEPTLDEGMEVSIDYYSLNEGVTNDDSVPVYQEIEDVIVYAALVYAASYFIDARKAEFENDFTTLYTEVQMDADVDALTFASINPVGGGVA